MELRYVVEARDREHVFSATGWSQKAVDGGEYLSEEGALREMLRLVESGEWEASDLRVGTRIRRAARVA